MQATLALIQWKIRHYDELFSVQNQILVGNCVAGAAGRGAARLRRLNGRKGARQATASGAHVSPAPTPK
ncbi:MAG TPA: hypothetical protein VFB20_01255 [Burkholderiales bacterium]|nr:hypothetical protein [Burkholderiales bacterium]